LQYYKVDSNRYRQILEEFAQSQQKVMTDVFAEVTSERGISQQSFGASLQRNMADPAVQERMMQLNTVQADVCEGQPVPEDLTRDRLKEVIRFQVAEMQKYPITSPITSMLAQVASSDEIFQTFGYDEITTSAAILKYDNDRDPELAELREQWNAAAKMNLIMGSGGQGQGHSHGPGKCSGHNH
jgi:hypothetical protein